MSHVADDSDLFFHIKIEGENHRIRDFKFIKYKLILKKITRSRSQFASRKTNGFIYMV